MRISDWSSDVCSSDLPRPFERSAGIPAVVVTFAHANPALSALAGDIGLAGLALGIEAVELHVQPFFAGFAGVDGATHAPHRCRDVGRSEEHTSELQSLMRISYAVFCLKKKKSNKTDTIK